MGCRVPFSPVEEVCVVSRKDVSDKSARSVTGVAVGGSLTSATPRLVYSVSVSFFALPFPFCQTRDR